MSLRAPLYRIYEGLRDVIAPGLRYSQELYEDALHERVTPAVRWLDLGCGHQVLPAWRAAAERAIVSRTDDLVGLDYELGALQAHKGLTAKVRGDVSALPFRDGSFELVTANMVVEHLAEPEAQFREIGRILAPGGLFMFHTPNVRGYSTAIASLMPEAIKGRAVWLLDGRPEEDVFPTHYRCNSEARVAEVAAATGFRVESNRMICSVPMTALIPPLAAVELAWVRLLMTRPMRGLRTNMIVALRKPTA